MLSTFKQRGKASFILGGQWGSEGKGAAAAFVGVNHRFDIVTTNAGAQAGHTSTHKGKTKVVFHLPTAALYSDAIAYLNAGSIIDPAVLLREIDENPSVSSRLFIHPNAAIITDACREAEGREDSAQTKIASTRKGVGEALSRKVLRSGMIARDCKELRQWVQEPIDLNSRMQWRNYSVLVEVPQGFHLSVDSQFYPHTTSRNCTVQQAAADAGIHPHFFGKSMLVLRTFPIRVGNIVAGDASVTLGNSGGHFADQIETTWKDLGRPPEITTVTKRIRRVFSFSEAQAMMSIAATRPDVIYLTFCDYLGKEGTDMLVRKLRAMSTPIHCANMQGPEILTQWGPTTDDVKWGE